MKVALGSPCHDKPDTEFVLSLVDTVTLLIARGHEQKFSFAVGSVHDGRNSLAHAAMHWGADVHVQLDADQKWRARDLVSSIELVGSGRADVVGFPIMTRSPTERAKRGLGPWVSPVMHAVDESAPARERKRRLPLRGFTYEDQRYVDVRDVSGIFVCSRACIEKLSATAERDDEGRPVLFDFAKVDGRRVSEDFFFNARWRALGGRIFCNVDAIVTHFGKSANVSDYTRTLDKSPIELESADVEAAYAAE